MFSTNRQHTSGRHVGPIRGTLHLAFLGSRPISMVTKRQFALTQASSGMRHSNPGCEGEWRCPRYCDGLKYVALEQAKIESVLIRGNNAERLGFSVLRVDQHIPRLRHEHARHLQ